MSKWDYFNIGMQTCAIGLMLYALIFGEVTIWPMKQPLRKYTVLYPVVFVILVIALVFSVCQMWR